jgi:hypothetical protein
MFRVVESEARMPTNQNNKSKDDQLCPPSEQSRHAAESAELAELNDLARFEGEGGHEPTTPDCVDVPLDNANWRTFRSNQNNQQKIQYE